MKIIYQRLVITPLYILGRLTINGDQEAIDTIELTNAQLTGELLRVTILRMGDASPRVLALVPDDYDYDAPGANSRAMHQCQGIIGMGRSYRSLKEQCGILVGQKDFPGSVTMSRKIYTRLLDRVAKCLQKAASRREVIQFVIADTVPVHLPVHPFWLQDPMHGNEPTPIHCEAAPNGDVLVYGKDGLIRIHTLQEQLSRYESL